MRSSLAAGLGTIDGGEEVDDNDEVGDWDDEDNEPREDTEKKDDEMEERDEKESEDEDEHGGDGSNKEGNEEGCCRRESTNTCENCFGSIMGGTAASSM
jgi:hypothetical protein